jgi:hypothetical protein
MAPSWVAAWNASLAALSLPGGSSTPAARDPATETTWPRVSGSVAVAAAEGAGGSLAGVAGSGWVRRDKG